MPRRQGLTGRRVSIVAAAKHRQNRLNETQEEKGKRLRLQREYSRRRRALETEEDKAQRKALDSQRRKRKRQQEGRLRRAPERQNLLMSRRPRTGSTDVRARGFISRPPGGILEPEITLVKSYNPGFVKFMMSICGDAATQDSTLTIDENADLGLSQGTSPIAAVDDGGKSPVLLRTITQASEDFETDAK